MSGFGVAGTPLGVAWGAAFRRKNPTGSPTLPGFQSGCGGCAGAKVWNSFWFGSGFATTGQAGQTLAGTADNGVRLATGDLVQVSQTVTGILEEPGVFPASGGIGQSVQTVAGAGFALYIPPDCSGRGLPLGTVYPLAFRRKNPTGSPTLPGFQTAEGGRAASRLWNLFIFGSGFATTGQAGQTLAGTADNGARQATGTVGQAGQTATGTAEEPGVIVLHGGTAQRQQTTAATATNTYSGPYDHFVVAQSDEIRTYYNTTLDWNQTGLGTVYAVAIDPAGNVYCAGTVVDGITTRKYNTSGELEWSANHGATVNALVVDIDGNVYTGGVRASSLTTRKYNSAGELQWSKDHGADVAALFLDSAGNLYAAGALSGGYNIRKYTPAGNLTWSKNFGSVALTAVVVSSTGNDIYVVETQRILRKYSFVTDDFYLQWSKDTSDYVYALAIDSNDLTVTGGNGALSGYSIYKYTVGGSISWRKTFDTGPTFYALAQALNGIIYAGSDVYSSNSVRRYGNTGSVTMLVATGATVRAIAFHKKAGRALAPGVPVGINVGLPDAYSVSPYSGIGETGQASQTAVGTAELSGMFLANGATGQGRSAVSGNLSATWIQAPDRFVAWTGGSLSVYLVDTLVWQQNLFVSSVVCDRTGNIYCAGASTNNLTTRKFDPYGNLLWSTNHGAQVNAVAVDSAGNIYTGGVVAGDSMTTRKYAATGALLWSRNHGEPVLYIAVDSAGNVYTHGDYHAASNSTTRKYAADGTLLWSRDYYYDDGFAVDSEGSCYLVDYDPGGLYKFDSFGNQEWVISWGWYLNGVAVDSYDYIYIVGALYNSRTLRKLNKYGHAQWNFNHGADLYTVTTDFDDNIWVMGLPNSSGITFRKLAANRTILSNYLFGPGAVRGLPPAAKLANAPGLLLNLGTGLPTDRFFEGAFPAGLALGVGCGIPGGTLPAPPDLEVLSRTGPVRQIWEAALGGAGQSDVLLLPVEALECRRRVNESAWLALAIPSATPALVAAIQERLPGDVVVMVSAGGTRGEFLRATVTDLAYDRTAGSGLIRLTARVIPTAFTRQNRVLFGVSQRTLDNGRRTVRCAVDPAVRPNDEVFDGLWTFVAGSIQYRITPTIASMTVVEILA